MMRSRNAGLLVLLLIPLALSVRPARAAPPTYPCYRPSVAPVIDGDIASDPAWRNIPAVTGFSVLGDGYALTKQTIAQACWDDQALYVAVTAEEPDAAQMVLKIRDGGNFWEDDGVELFFQPGKQKPVFQFGVTAGGAKGGFQGSPDFTKFQAKAKIGRDSYCLEVRLPYEVIGFTPKLGEAWAGDFCRNTFTVISGGSKFTCWAPLKTQFNEPENYAEIRFMGPAPDAAEAAAIGERLNAPYRVELMRALGVSAGQGEQYIPALTEAARDAKYGKAAGDLLRRWQQAQRMSGAPAVRSGASKVSVLELRRMIAGMDSLAKASYDLQYAYLIAKVLPD